MEGLFVSRKGKENMPNCQTHLRRADPFHAYQTAIQKETLRIKTAISIARKYAPYWALVQVPENRVLAWGKGNEYSHRDLPPCLVFAVCTEAAHTLFLRHTKHPNLELLNGVLLTRAELYAPAFPLSPAQHASSDVRGQDT